jgi:hypothetical protein
MADLITAMRAYEANLTRAGELRAHGRAGAGALALRPRSERPMVERIGKDSALAREAVAAALRRASGARAVAAQPAGAETGAGERAGLRARARGRLERVDEESRTAENPAARAPDRQGLRLPRDRGAAQDERAVLQVRMEIRNKLVDA